MTGLARLEFARRKLACLPERLVPIRLPIHDEYDFTPAALPVIEANDIVMTWKRISGTRTIEVNSLTFAVAVKRRHGLTFPG